MKKLFFSLLVLIGVLSSNHLAAQAHFSTEIGELVNGNAVITYDMDTLKAELAAFLSSQSSISVTFSSATIELDSNHYLLVASNATNTIKTAVGLVRDGNSFYQEDTTSSIGGKSSCTCSPCNYGCSPQKLGNGEWNCKPCSESYDPPRECNKSETASGVAIFGGGGH